MWFDRARFGHLDDDAFDALHDLAKQDTQSKDDEPVEQSKQQSVKPKHEREKVGTDSVLKLTDFSHLHKSRNPEQNTPSIKPIKDPHDGRWVLAVRTAESIRHGQLEPEKHQRLVKLGKLLGLSPLDSQRIINIIVEHAQRGIDPAQLTRQTFAELEQTSPPPMRPAGRVNWFFVGMTTLLMMLIEFAALFAWFRK
ncbi:MAG TPA: hypothetical protein DCM28_15965 [Phycisphaerales bacterium]|nr:hypothetical protein [Phycisphaerales bacterium]HCD33502.1 hypothetical protein [Phycisphaerales bacterium]|tara:strand:- start:67322 stop:67909 length:588 start_codon:yes stop_codon:yes gene_type:complete